MARPLHKRRHYTITRGGRVLLGTYKQRKQRRGRKRAKLLRTTNRLASRLHGPHYAYRRGRRPASLKRAVRAIGFV